MMVNGSKVLILLSLFVVSVASAKDLTSRLGVGYTDQFATIEGSLPSVAVKYYPSANLAFSAALGVDTKEGGSKFGFMAKMYRILFSEDNMNFYMGAGAGLLSEEEESSVTSSGFELNGFAGGEFFLNGLESVGFSFEMGVGVTSVSSEVRFRTIGDHPVRAGMIFYF